MLNVMTCRFSQNINIEDQIIYDKKNYMNYFV